MDKGLAAFLTVVLIMLSVVFMIVGWRVMYTYYSGYGGTGNIVGGDAYNYIIIANRGIGWFCAGIIVAIIANITARYHALLSS